MASASDPKLTLTINGTPFVFDGSSVTTPNAGFGFVQWVVYSKESEPSLVLMIRGGPLPPVPDPMVEVPITLAIDVGSGDVVRFAGRCMDPSVAWQDDFGWGRTYRVDGLQSLGDLVPISNVNTGGDTHVFNSDPEDYINYRGDSDGRTVGEMILRVLGDPVLAEDLDGYGIGGYSSFGFGAAGTAVRTGDAITSISLDNPGSDYGAAPTVVVYGGGGTGATATASVSGGEVTGFTIVDGGEGFTGTPKVYISPLPYQTILDLARIEHVPPYQVVIGGDRALSVLQGSLRLHAQNFVLHVEPDGTLRFLDIRRFGSGTDGYGGEVVLTMNGDDLVQVEQVSLARPTKGCASRLVIRGNDYAEMKMYETVDGSFEEVFDHDGLDNDEAKEAWKLTDWQQPDAPTSDDSGSGVYGAASCTDTLTVELNPDDNLLELPADYYDQTGNGRHGVVFLIYEGVPGVTNRVTRRIVSHTSLTAGGTFEVTLDQPIPHLDYDKFLIRGLTGGASNVWRRYRITDPDERLRMRPRATVPAPIVNANGGAAATTSTAVMEILWSASGAAPWYTAVVGCTINYDTGDVIADKPVVTWFGTPELLETGGDAVDGIPYSVRFFVPISTDRLRVVSPPDVLGVPQYAGTLRTVDGIERTLTLTSPQWRDPNNLVNLQRYADEVLDTVKDTKQEGTIPVLKFDPRFLDMGVGLSLEGYDYPTGWEDANVPVSECVVTFNNGTGARYVTTVRISNSRQAFSSSLYERPPSNPLIFGSLDGTLRVPQATYRGTGVPGVNQ